MNVVIHAGGIHNTSALNELRRYHVMDFNSKLTFPDGKGWKMVAIDCWEGKKNFIFSLSLNLTKAIEKNKEQYGNTHH